MVTAERSGTERLRKPFITLVKCFVILGTRSEPPKNLRTLYFVVSLSETSHYLTVGIDCVGVCVNIAPQCRRITFRPLTAVPPYQSDLAWFLYGFFPGLHDQSNSVTLFCSDHVTRNGSTATKLKESWELSKVSSVSLKFLPEQYGPISSRHAQLTIVIQTETCYQWASSPDEGQQ